MFRAYNKAVITPGENEDREAVVWAKQLSDLADGRPVDWSDTWTDEDLADLQRASLVNFDTHESGGS